MLGVAEPPAPGGCDPIAGAGMGGGGGPAARPATNQMIPPTTTTAATIRPITVPVLKFCPMKGLLLGAMRPLAVCAFGPLPDLTRFAFPRQASGPGLLRP